jgi:regulator of sigma E protease
VEFDDVGTLYLSPVDAVIWGGKLTWRVTELSAVGISGFFSHLFTGKADFSQVSGPIGILHEGAPIAASSFSNFLFFTAAISISLGLMNILPIPGLDGGRLLFIVIEGLRKKAIPESLQSRLTFIGFAALILLVIVVSYHDVLRWVNGS